MFIQHHFDFQSETIQYQYYSPSKKPKHTLVCLHGYGLGTSIFNDICNEFSRDYAIALISLPGFDGSAPPKNYNLAYIATCISACILDAKWTNVVLIGHSLGGYIALEMLHAQPTSFQACVLLHSHAFGDAEDRKAERHQVAQFVRKHGSAVFIKEAFKKVFSSQYHDLYLKAIEKFKTISADVLAEYSIAMANRGNRMAVIQSASIPIILVSGELDALIPRTVMADMAAEIPQGAWVSISQSGHISTLEQPQAFYYQLDRTLQTLNFAHL